MRIVLKVVIAGLIVFSGLYDSWVISHSVSLPFSIQLLDRHTVAISPTPGLPLPAALQAGDRIDLTRMDLETRTLINLEYNGRTLPEGVTYSFPFIRDGRAFTVPVTTVALRATDLLRVVEAVSTFIAAVVSVIGLLMIWRGRDRAATGLAVWCLGFNLGVAFNAIPIGGALGIAYLCFAIVLFLLSRLGFFLMVEHLVAPVLPRPWRTASWAAFSLMLLLGGLQGVGSMVYFAATGDAEWMLPRYSFLFSWIYVVPLAMALLGYAYSKAGSRVKLAWVAVAAVLITVAVTIVNAIPIGFLYSYSIAATLLALSLFTLSYALLRHRLVTLALVVDRALVYGIITTLVVGLVAAINTLVLRVALPPSAGLVVQGLMTLLLAIALRQVKVYLDRIVERVFFRGKYLSEKALRAFVRRVGHFDDASALLGAAADEMRRHARAPAVAIYSAEESGYRRLQRAGQGSFPATLRNDDAALVAARAEHRAVDLGSLTSALGEDACVFPMLVLGNLRGVVVCKNRPGEHFGADEKRLLTHVAREVGAAWRILRARDNEEYVTEMAEGELTLKAARQKARALVLSWVGS